jgi:hypothetical protein
MRCWSLSALAGRTDASAEALLTEIELDLVERLLIELNWLNTLSSDASRSAFTEQTGLPPARLLNRITSRRTKVGSGRRWLTSCSPAAIERKKSCRYHQMTVEASAAANARCRFASNPYKIPFKPDKNSPTQAVVEASWPRTHPSRSTQKARHYVGLSVSPALLFEIFRKARCVSAASRHLSSRMSCHRPDVSGLLSIDDRKFSRYHYVIGVGLGSGLTLAHSHIAVWVWL